MKNLFNYENKLMQAVMTFADLVILNVLFLLCCIPIVTIGAAQAGLYSGIKVLVDKEDDSSPAAAFFRGFSNGFLKITLVYTVMLIAIAASGYVVSLVFIFQASGISDAPLIVSIIALCIFAMFQSLICLFHSRFNCSIPQLFRNVWLIFLAHPLRSILVAVLTWAPIVLLLIDLRLFMTITPVVATILYGFLFLLSYSIMHKPFQDLIQMYNERNGITPESQQIPCEEEIEE